MKNLMPLGFLTKFNLKKEEKFLGFTTNPNNLKKILVFRNGMLGDVTFVTSVLNRLINTFPNAEIDIVVGPKAISVLESFPKVKKVIPFTFGFSFFSLLRQILYFIKLRQNKYDVVIIQEVNTHYTILGKLVGAKFLVGFKNRLSFLYDYFVERPKVKAVLAELETVKKWTTIINRDKSYLFVTKDEIQRAKQLLFQNGMNGDDDFILIHPGSNSPNSDRQWVKERYGELADLLIEGKRINIVFTGVNHDIPVIEEIMAGMKNKSISLAGKKDLRLLMALIKLSKMVIGIDTGILHIAAALDTPVIMMMGLADPEDTGVYNPNDTVKIIRVNLPCSPCVHKSPKPVQWDECKNMRPVKCMRMIETQVVFKSVISLLNK